ncbi:metallophosphoesterase family protein [Parathermosynechococcus lividus]
MVGDRLIFIGDVHGHYEGLCRLLDVVAPTAGDRLYFLGDLVDRGPNSAAVVELLRQQRYFAVRGNHEDMMLLAFENKHLSPSRFFVWASSGGDDTLASYTSTERLWEHIHWLETTPLYYDLGNVFLVHAGLDPMLPLADQTNKECCWIRDLFLSHPTPYFADKTIVVGHTITFTFRGVSPGQLVRGNGWIDIDTGAYHHCSGWLTALDWSRQWVWQMNVLHGGIRQGGLEEFVVDLATVDCSKSD